MNSRSSKKLAFLPLVLLLFPFLFVGCVSPSKTQHVSPTFPTFPFEGKIIFEFQEQSRGVTLLMWTESRGYAMGDQIKAELSTNGATLNVRVLGLGLGSAATAIDSARCAIFLGKMGGVHTLRFINGGASDNYRLETTADTGNLRASSQATFTLPYFDTWRRLPPDTIWFITQSLGQSRTSLWKFMTMDEYQSYVNDFFAQIEARGAKQFVPQEGYYPYQGFVPPWPDEQTVQGGITSIETPMNGGWNLVWGDIRFFHYAGNLAEITKLIDDKYALRSTQMFVNYYTVDGELYPHY